MMPVRRLIDVLCPQGSLWLTLHWGHLTERKLCNVMLTGNNLQNKLLWKENINGSKSNFVNVVFLSIQHLHVNVAFSQTK